MKQSTRRTIVATGVVGIAACAFLAGRALAGGIPATGALTYSGLLQNPDGTVRTGSPNIQVNFWPAATGGVTPACQTTSAPIALDGGRFSVVLPDTCTDTVKNGTGNIWAEVLVDGATLGRTKLGAVPYAVEAGHATSADTATSATSATNATNATNATGALATRIAAIENSLPSKSAFLARRSTTQLIANNAVTTAAFDSEVFDLGGEFAANTFAPKSAGYYYLSCTIEWGIGTPGTATGFFETALYVNGSRDSAVGSISDGYYSHRQVSGFLKLAAGDSVTCRAYQGTGASQNTLADAQNSFSGFRVSP